MIPKKIHYCWFGGKPLPKLAKKCINSWRKFCPDYEIIEWNEKNFDINCCDYVREAYNAGKWAFVSDVARLYALVNYGGIYMDTDVEVIKPLDYITQFDAVSGFEDEKKIPTGIMACCRKHPFFVELLNEYNNARFIKNGRYDLTTNVERITNTCVKHGLCLDNTLQTVNGFTLFPKDYFCPIDLESGKLNCTDNTYTIHWFSGSWVKPYDKFRGKVYKFINRYFGKKTADFIKNFAGSKREN